MNGGYIEKKLILTEKECGMSEEERRCHDNHFCDICNEHIHDVEYVNRDESGSDLNLWRCLLRDE